jgi:hypothetical protein
VSAFFEDFPSKVILQWIPDAVLVGGGSFRVLPYLGKNWRTSDFESNEVVGIYDLNKKSKVLLAMTLEPMEPL